MLPPTMSNDDERQRILRDLHALIDAFFPTTAVVTPGNAELAPVKPQKTLVDFFGGLKRKKAPEEKKNVRDNFADCSVVEGGAGGA